jgi:hypothetical protein
VSRCLQLNVKGSGALKPSKNLLAFPEAYKGYRLGWTWNSNAEDWVPPGGMEIVEGGKCTGYGCKGYQGGTKRYPKVTLEGGGSQVAGDNGSIVKNKEGASDSSAKTGLTTDQAAAKTTSRAHPVAAKTVQDLRKTASAKTTPSSSVAVSSPKSGVPGVSAPANVTVGVVAGGGSGSCTKMGEHRCNGKKLEQCSYDKSRTLSQSRVPSRLVWYHLPYPVF